MSNYKKKFDILVLRISLDSKLKSSRPCYNCLKELGESNLRIRYVYYSTVEGIKRETFSKMLTEETIKYISSGRRKICEH